MKIAKNKGLTAQAGFTLIEILVVIGIIALLAAIVIIAINPARQFAQARNSQRVSNLNTILNAIGQNMADNKGVWTCGGVYFNSSSASTTITSGTTGALLSDLSCLVPTYIAAGIPVDPSGGSSANTKYQISTTTSGVVLLCASESSEAALGLTSDICVTR
jgi:prepilin-type N-terminal cleavage/methylation domain-containing protein